jgi:hypothetical protein
MRLVAGLNPGRMRRVTTSGYSGKPLTEKLGIKAGHRVYVDGGPSHTGELLGGTPYTTRLPRHIDVTLLFTTELSRLEKRLAIIVERTVTDGMVWVCWPKKASKVPTEVDENDVRRIGLATGLVDVKVAAVDETWSGLKLVRRLRDR